MIVDRGYGVLMLVILKEKLSRFVLIAGAVVVALAISIPKAQGVIAFDAQSSGNGSGIATLSWSHTIGGGADRKLMVGVTVEEDNSVSGDENVTSITYNGVALTFVNAVTVTTANNFVMRAEIWYIDEANLPASGTALIQVNLSGPVRDVNAGAVSIDGALSGAPEATATNTIINNPVITTSITTLTDGAWLIDVVGSGNGGNFTPGAGQTERWDTSSALNTATGASSTKPVATAGLNSMTQTHSTTSLRTAHAVIAVAPTPIAAIGEYQFEQCNPITTVTDSSVNGFNGTGNGDLSTLGLAPAQAGDPGTCRYGVFDGSGDFVSIPNQGGGLEPTVVLSYAAWVRWDQAGDIEQHVITNGDVDRVLGVTGPGHAQGQGRAFFRLPINATARDVFSTTALTDGAWHHIAGTFDGRIMTVYVDSTAEATLDVTGAVPTGVRVSYWIRRGADAFSEDPDGGEHLRIEYLNNVGTWVQIRQLTGQGPQGQIFTFTDNLAADALHANFRLRFQQRNGSGSDFDYWHVDDVRIEGNVPGPGWQTYFFDNFDDGSLGTDWTVTGTGNAGVGTQTSNSGINSLFTRWNQVFVTSLALDLGQSPDESVDPGASDTHIGSAYGSSALDGEIDEVRVFDLSLTGTQITNFMNSTHACTAVCPTMDHYAISHDGTGITCLSDQITITPHDAADNPVDPGVGTVITLTTSTGRGTWASIVTGTGILSDPVAGDGSATYTFPGVETSVTLAFNYTNPAADPETVNFNVTDGTFTEPGPPPQAEDPDMSFASAGFQFLNEDDGNTTIPTQIAGKDSNVAPNNKSIVLQAIRVSDADSTVCEPIFSSGATVSVELGAECNNPNTCAGQQVSVTNNAITTAIATNNDNGGPGTTSYTSVPLLFGLDSKASLPFNYSDVGQIQLHARFNIPLDDGASTPSGNYMVGSSNAFVERPFAFHVTATGNPGASGPAGAVFTQAGANFTANVRAVIWQAADDTDNNGIADNHNDTNPANNADLSGNAAAPNYGQETVTENVTLTSLLDQPAGGVDPVLAGTTTVSSFVAGSGSTTVRYDEVGIIELSATITDNDYLGIGAAETSNIVSRSGYVGRFYPNDFVITIPALTNRSDLACASIFTYMEENFRIDFDLMARAATAGNPTTQNYITGGFAKLDPTVLANMNYGATGIDPDTAARIDFTTPVRMSAASSGSFTNGVANVQGTISIDKAPNPDGPFNPLEVGIAPLDSDGVVLNSLDLSLNGGPNTHGKLDQTEIRFGRAVIENAFGSPFLNLDVPLRTEYYTGNTNGFITNGDDNCTAFTFGMLTLSNTFNPGTTPTIQIAAGGSTTTATIGNNPVSSGDANLTFTAPTLNESGYTDIDVDLSTMLWFVDPPTARATFGTYRGDDRIIYWREIF